MSKTIAYDYCFNCADIPYNDEIIDGTSVMISFVAYNALFKEINLWDAMRTVEGYGISDLIKVSFDNENEYTIQCRQKVLDAFYRDYGFLSLHCKPIGYSLCVKIAEGYSKDVPTTEEIYRSIISENKELFDISDNRVAQTLAYMMVEADTKDCLYFVPSKELRKNKCCIGESGEESTSL